jgi:hypothetical protein
MASNAKAINGKWVRRGSVPVEFRGFSVLADLAVVDGKLIANLQVFRVHHRFIVQRSEHDLPLLVTAMHPDPHPFARESPNFAVELDLDVISPIKPGHTAPLSPYCR